MENTLTHYGIKGMKWGVRRYQNKDGTLTAQGRKRYSEDYTNAHSKKPVSEMSDAELRTRLNRLNMEAQYKKLNPSTVSKGKKYASTVLKAGTTIATVSTTAINIYNNWSKIKDILGK